MLGKLSRRPVDQQSNGESRKLPTDPARLAAEVASLEAEVHNLRALVRHPTCYPVP